MKENLEKFFNCDFHYVQVGLNREKDIRRRDEIYWNARQRALGAIDVAQIGGLDYETAEMMYNEYCHKLEVAVYEVR